jgi:hypothetical protein
MLLVASISNFKLKKKKNIFGSSVPELSFGWRIFFTTWQPKKGACNSYKGSFFWKQWL